MTTITDQQQIDAIQSAYNSQNWQLAYKLVFDAITTMTTVQDSISLNPSPGVDPAVWLWISGARNVNSDNGAFANYIRDYTAEQYLLRTGQSVPGGTTTSPSALIQVTSNIISKRFIADLFGLLPGPEATPPDQITGSFTSLTLPDLNRVGAIDAGAAASTIFNGTTADGSNNYSPWAGTVLFTQLGENSFFKDWVLTTGTNDHKQELGTYDLATVAKASTDLFTTEFLLKVLATDLSTAISVLPLGSQASSDAAAATNAFFGATYGVAANLLDIGSDIFSQFRLSNHVQYVVGTTKDDGAIQSLDGAEFLNAGRGDDTILGAYSSSVLGATTSVIDGAEGIDTIDYSKLNVAVSVTFENVGQLGVRAAVAKDPEAFVHTDYVYEVEKYKFGKGADKVTIAAGADLSKIRLLDGGDQPAGEKDVLDLTSYTHKLSVVNGHLIGDGVDIEISNFEEVRLPGFGDDDVVRGDDVDRLYTGDGDDTASTSVPGLFIDLGEGNDVLKSSGPGTIVHTGSGNDKIEASHNGQLLIEDASATDHITYYGNTLTGGVQWGTESKYAYGLHGERYGRNAQGNLVIIDGQGNETFIPGFNFTTEATNLTAGLFVIQVTYRIERSNGWTAGFETAASALAAMKKIAQATTGKLRGGTDPLVLDLNGDGVNLSSTAGNNASFDVDKDGFAERVGWVRGGDGMLVRDLNGNGKIDDIGEMFGNDQTPGFTQLASLDGNHDGKISTLDDGLADFNGDGTVDASDTFASLKVWVDANEDGKTDAGELKSLASLDIVSISTGSTATNTTDSGNIIAASGTFERIDGTTGTIGEIQFDTDNTNTTWQGDSSVSADAATRPDLKGFGTLTDLHVAMTLDPDLVQKVDAALPSLNTLSLASLREAARTILYAWAGAVQVPAGTPGTEATQDFWFVGDVTRTGGVAYDFLVQKGEYGTTSGENVPYYGYASGQPVYNADKTLVYGHPTIDMVLASPPAQGSWNKLTAQDVAFLERYTGLDLGFVISENPSADAVHVVADGVTASWNTLNRLAVRLAAQGPLAPFFAGITYDVASDTFRPTTDHQLVPMLEAIFHAAPATASGAQDFLAQWHDIINVVLPDFQRDNQGHQLTDAFLFQNLVGAYEDAPLAISLQQAAAIFDIPASEIKTGSGTLLGNDGNTDLFYLDSPDQVLKGRGGSDAYVVGYNFGHDVIQDVWEGLGRNQEDSIWFSHLNVSDLTFVRDGVDLLITQNGTDNQIRVIDEFAGRRPGLVTAFQDFDKQIEIIKFADGTTWDQLDIAKAIGMPSYATDDHLVGTPDVDFLNGGGGIDYMSGGDAGDHYFFGRGDGQDTIEDREVWIWQASNDYVHFGTGITEDDVTFQRAGLTDDLQIRINGTNDVLTVTDQFSVAYGLLNTQQDRIEIFTFDDGSYVGWEDIIKALDAAAGTSGDDVIHGFSYDDLLDGGAGDDFLSGGNGNDTYVFGRGYGSDTIEDRLGYILSGTDDTVQFKAGISQSDLTFHHDGNTSDLRITVNGTDDSLTIKGEFYIIYGLFPTMDNRIENFTFADGTVLGWHDILLQINEAAGTSENDTIYGSGYDDTLQGRAGDDYLCAESGNDTYVYTRGDGNDTIYDIADAQGPEFDTLVLHGINPADVSFVRNGLDVALVFADSAPGAGDGGSVLLQGELDNWFNQGVEQIIFDNGTVWTQNDLRLKVLAQASTPGNDTIDAFNTNDVIEGGRGDDTISGGAGDDTYIYTRGDGNDSITEVGAGNWSSFDILKLKAIDPAAVSLVRNGDNLTLVIAESAPGAGDGGSVLIREDLKGWTASGVEQVVFDDGTIWSQDYLRARILVELTTDSNDVIAGFSTGDTLRGGKGDDLLYGGAGDDTYVYARGDGNDLITEVFLGNYDSTDTLRLQNVDPAAVRLGRSQNDVTLIIAETAPGAGDGGSILLKDELAGTQLAGVETVVFDDGTVWNQEQMRLRVLADASTDGNDVINGFAGNDILRGGKGDDTLSAGSGDDTYIYARGDGDDTIYESWAGNSTAHDTLKLQGVAPSEVSLVRNGEDVTLVIPDSAPGAGVAGSILLKASLNDVSQQGVDEIVFDDGTVWSQATLRTMLLAQATASADTSIFGFNTDDTIVAGLGDRYLSGSYGSDTYVYSASGGNDIIDDFGSNTLVMQGIASTDILVARPDNGRDLILTNSATGQTLTVKNQFFNSGSLSTITFADGVSWSAQDILNLLASQTVIYGTEAAETVTGTSNAETIDGLGGDDVLNGGNEGDIYLFRIGSGNDTILETGSNGGNDVARLVGLDAGDVDVTKNGNDLLIRIVSSGETLTVKDHYLGPGTGIEYLQFCNGTLLDLNGIAQLLHDRAAAYLISPSAFTDTPAQRQAKLASYGVSSIIDTSSGTGSIGGTGGVDAIFLGTGDKAVNGGGAADFYVYGADGGNVTITDPNYQGGVASLLLNGLSSTDVTLSRPNGGTGMVLTNNTTGKTVTVQGEFGRDGAMQSIIFADGVTWTREFVKQKLLDQQSARSGGSIWGYSDRNDVLVAGLGDKYLAGQGGEDTYVYSSAGGNDIVDDQDRFHSTLQLLDIASTDVLLSRPGGGYDLVMTVLSTGRTITVLREFGNGGPLKAIAFADSVSWSQQDVLDKLASSPTYGTPGADTIYGTSSADIIDGLAGNDALAGGDGGDIYVYKAGSGNDTVTETGAGTGTDVVKLVGLNSSDVTFSRTGDDLFIRINSTGEALKVLSQFDGTNGIEQILFADGTSLDRNQISSVAWVFGTPGDDVIALPLDTAIVKAGGGNDALGVSGTGSNRILFAKGDGHDTLDNPSSGYQRNDTLDLTDILPSEVELTRSGNQLIVKVPSTGDSFTVLWQFYTNGASVFGINNIKFADGTIWDHTTIASNAWIRGTSGNDSVYGSPSGDVLFGDTGKDYLRGGDGADTYVYKSGDGNDEIDDESASVVDVDVLKFSDLNSGDITLSRSGNDLLVGIIPTGQTIKIDYQFLSQTSNWGVEKFQFANGETWDLQTINAAWIRGTSGNDSLLGTASDDYLVGLQGNDYLRGNGGSDTYVYRFGDGNDEIDDESNSTVEVDTLRLSDLNASDVLLTRSGSDLLIGVIATGQTIKIDYQFYSQTANWGIEKLQFADGQTWDLQTINANAWLRGTAGNDSIGLPSDGVTVDGRAGDDTLGVAGTGSDRVVFYKGAGHDTLDNPSSGYQRNDTLDLTDILPSEVELTRSGNQLIVKVPSTGDSFTVLWQFYTNGASVFGINNIKFADGTIWDRTAIASNAWIRGTSGNDSISLPTTDSVVDAGAGDDSLGVAGTGSDRVVFYKGAGHDTLDNPSSGYQRNDTLDLTDILPSEVELTRSGNQLIVKVPSTGDSFTVLWQFYTNGASVFGINNIKFADGTIWDRTAIASNAWIRGTSGNDSIGLPATDVTVDAGAGNDSLGVRDNGSDRIMFYKGAGHDTLDNPGSGYNRDDTLVLLDINPWDVQFTRSGDSMTMTVASTGDSFQAFYQFWGNGSQIQGLTHVQFANGANWSRSNISDATSTFTWVGSTTNATLSGNEYGLNIFQIGTGAEMVYGGARSNVYQITTSTGQAQISLSSAAGSKNEVDFLSGITDQNLWFERVGDDLKIDLLGTNTTTTIGNWFSASSGALQEITAGGLKIDSQISQLVQAMSTYSANNTAFDPANSNIHTLPTDTALQNSVAAAWHA